MLKVFSTYSGSMKALFSRKMNNIKKKWFTLYNGSGCVHCLVLTGLTSCTFLTVM